MVMTSTPDSIIEWYRIDASLCRLDARRLIAADTDARRLIDADADKALIGNLLSRSEL
jgi:hypothetical protein